jgi:hypothetical protein
VNALLGHTNVRNDLPNLYAVLDNDGGRKAYVLTPQSGFWMAVIYSKSEPPRGTSCP